MLLRGTRIWQALANEADEGRNHVYSETKQGDKNIKADKGGKTTLFIFNFNVT